MPQVLTMSLKELLGNHNVKQIANVRLGAEGEIKPKSGSAQRETRRMGKYGSLHIVLPTSIQYFPSVRAVAGLR